MSMFSKIFRLNSRTFSTVFQKGLIAFGDYFRMKYVSSSEFKVSIVIPKKLIKKRVDRNREKRRITHLLKECIFTDTHYYYIFWLTKDSQKLSSKELKDFLQKVIKKQR
jgi:ribonuclease P protein component